MIEQTISQEDFISTIANYASTLEIDVVNASHYQEHSDYYWKNKNQFISVINKGLSADKLKVIFQTHIQKLSHENEKCELVYPPMKIMNTKKYSVYVWA